MKEHMEQYKRDINNQLDITLDSEEFWIRYGYLEQHTCRPSNKSKYLRRKLTDVKPLLKCSKCHQWRQLRYNPMLLQPKDSWDSWDCSMNTDSVKRSCKEREEFDKIVTSQLKPVFEKKLSNQ